MDKKIVSLLDSNLRVIIPDFGAFIIRQQEPKVVVFNELLKNNDGILVDHIIKTENVDAEVARQLVADFISYAVRTLDSGKVFIIEGLGKLWKDRTGRISFVQENENMPVEADASVQPITRYAVQQQFNQPEKSEVKQGSITQISNHLVRWIVVLVCANLAIVAFFVFKNDIRQSSGKEKKSGLLNQSVVNQLADSISAAVADTSIIFRAGPSVPMLEEVKNKEDGNLRYYIVAGCFKDEVNADQLVTSLKNMGYSAEKFGKIGDLYAVSFASFDNKDIAVKELARIREEFRPDAWMTQF